MILVKFFKRLIIITDFLPKSYVFGEKGFIFCCCVLVCYIMMSFHRTMVLLCVDGTDKNGYGYVCLFYIILNSANVK